MRQLVKSICISFLAFMVVTTVQAEDPRRTITKIFGDLYRFQNNFHYSVFLVTSEGVIATDPIDADAATWLKETIAARFDKKIKYVIYSHDHRDHIAGGEVWADDATIIAHENTKRAILNEKRPTAVPDITFSDSMTIELGGQKVHLKYLGRSHSDNMIVVHFPAHRAVFAVDFVSVRRLPFRDLSDAYFPDWMEAIKRLNQIDYDLIMPGHGPMGGKNDAAAHGKYLQELYDAVMQAAREGQSLEKMKKTITLGSYANWSQYSKWRELNIEGAYRHVVLHRRGN